MSIKPTINFVEGNIGSGKTTICRIIEKRAAELGRTDIVVIYEPVDLWREMGLLDAFYKDMPRWGYTFQNTAFITKIMALNRLDPRKIYVVERSPYTDMECFAKLCHSAGNINDMEWKIYKLWYDHFINKLEEDNNINFVYLKTSPQICHERIHKRNRGEESGIPIEYLKSLDTLHNEWLSSKANILNGDVEFETDDYNSHLHWIFNNDTKL
jgi:deoxyadenosine/deoxycytidine kinase